MKKGFKQTWEEWYGDMVCDYQWHEIEYKGRKVLYVCGRATVGDEDKRLNSGFTQVMGYLDPEELLSEEEQKRMWVLRRVLSEMPMVEAVELLRDRVSRTKSNAEFLNTMNLNA